MSAPRWATAIAGAAIVTAAALLWARAGYVPIWDGRIYADCFVAAARAFPSAAALRCADHPSQAYALLVALPQLLAPGSTAVLLATNATLFVVAGLAFRRVVAVSLPGQSLAAERTLLLAAFAVHPVLLAGVVQPGLDFGVLVFFLCATAAALERRLGWMVAFGLLLSFSKETGALLYALLAAVYAFDVAAPRPVPRALQTALLGAGVGLSAGVLLVPAWPAGLAAGVALGGIALLALRPRPLPEAYAAGRIARALAPVAPAALPTVVYGGYLMARALRPVTPTAGSGLWMGETGGSVLRTLLLPGMGGAAAAYLALLFVLGFLWVPGAAVAADLAVGATRYLRGERPRPADGVDGDAVRVVAALTAGTVYLLTRYPTYANARYLLPAYPLLLVCAGVALIRLRVPAAGRRTALAAVAGLFAVSTTVTADPVSRALWGTFPVGTHRLLRTTSLTGECCGWGRDQLAYNLEFTTLAGLQDAALAHVRPVERDRALSATALAAWYIIGPLDRGSRRSLRSDTVRPRVIDPERLPPALPDSLWFLDVPNVDGSAARRALGRYYRIDPPDTVRSGGYAMAVWPLVLHASDRPAEPHPSRTGRSAARSVTARPIP